MKTLFRGECFRLTHSAALMLALVILLVCDLFFSSRSTVTEQNMYELSELPTRSEFLQYCEASHVSVPGGKALLKKLGAITDSDAEDLLALFQDAEPYYFRFVLAGNKGLLFMPILFGIIFLARDFPGKAFHNPLYVGKRRRAIFAAKALFYILLVFLLSFLGILLLTVLYAGSVFSHLPPVYVWSRLLLHAFMDTGLCAFPFFVGYLTLNPFVTGVVTLAYSALIRYTGLIWPAASKAKLANWEQGASILPLLLPALVFLLVFVSLSYVCFEKKDLS